jgi:MarC family membrane protein
MIRRSTAASIDETLPLAMNSELVSAAILLLLVLDPIGNVPLVVSALQAAPPKRRVRIVLRECLIAYIVLLGFLFGGHAFLTLMHLSETSLSIAGGVILFLIALRMVFAHPEGVFGDSAGAEPFIVPLAIPAIAGPSALATVMLMASRDPQNIGSWAAALTAAMAVTTLTLVAAGRLQRLLGERAIRAFERLMGLVLTAVAIEMLLTGMKSVAGQFQG